MSSAHVTLAQYRRTCPQTPSTAESDGAQQHFYVLLQIIVHTLSIPSGSRPCSTASSVHHISSRVASSASQIHRAPRAFFLHSALGNAPETSTSHCRNIVSAHNAASLRLRRMVHDPSDRLRAMADDEAFLQESRCQCEDHPTITHSQRGWFAL